MRLPGRIPTEIGQCLQLETLWLQDSQLTGSFAFCNRLSDGKRVYHSDDLCAGHMPTEIGQLTAMQRLRLNHNYLSGTPLIAHICRLVNERTT